MRTKTKKFKTAQGFLESRYNTEFGYRDPDGETREAKIQRSRHVEREAVRSLISAIGLSAKIGDDEDLRQAVQRIQQMPEAQNARHQHFLKGTYAWLKRGRVIILGATFTGVTTVGPSDAV
jgi:hypothetical protein